jgi:zinc finger protein
MSVELPSGDGWQKGNEEDISEIRGCYCPNCEGGNGVTMLLPTKVPGFREIIIASLICDDCQFRNAEVSFGGEIQTKGSKLTLTVTSSEDLNRQVLKSDSATLSLPVLDLDIPPNTQRGTLTTIEGVLFRAQQNLSLLQPERLRLGDLDNFNRCQAVVDKIKRLISNGNEGDKYDEDEEGLVFPFELIIDDPAGNSFIENPHVPNPDPHLKKETYERTPRQDMSLGLQPSQAAVEDGTIQDSNPQHKNVANKAASHGVTVENQIGRQEVIKFPTTCSNCYKPAETDMCVIDIPHFKEVVIMSLVCEQCGYKSNEIKGGGGIPKFGCRIILTVRGPDDLAREVLKSDSAGIEIPEVELELEEGGMDGVYTSIEGLILKMRDRLTKANPFGSGDAAKKQHLSNDGGNFSEPSETNARYLAFLAKLNDMAEGNAFPFTLILSDPLANSFVGPIPKDAMDLSLQAETEGSKSCYDSYVDLGMELEEFERTHDQNEILGLNDMKTEGYRAADTDTAADTDADADTDAADATRDYGTDQMEEVPDRIRRLDIRGPDHPHQVGKAPVEGDTTVMGAGSANFSVPSMGQRGKMKSVPQAPVPTSTSASTAP